AAVGSDGRVYVAGGSRDTYYNTVNTLLIYNPASDTWSYGASMHENRADFPLLAGSNGLLYAIGGVDIACRYCDSATVEAYDPTTDQWTYVAPMNEPRDNFTGVATPDGHLYVFGGYDHNGTGFLSRVDVYSI